MPEPGRERTLIAGLGAALMAALLVIAFLLGRQTAPTAPTAPAAPTAATEPAPPRPVAPPVAPAEPAGQAPPEPKLIIGEGGRPTIVSVDGLAPPPAAAPRAATADPAVQSYFAAVDRLQTQTGSGDPMAFAQSLIQDVQQNDMSGMDALIRDAKKAHAEAAKLTPPAACEEHHAELLELLEASASLMSDLKEAIVRRDVGTLSGIATRSQSIQARADRLAAERKRLLEPQALIVYFPSESRRRRMV